MSGQTIVTLTREQAEEKYVKQKLEDPDYQRKIRVEAASMTNKQLEEAIKEYFFDYIIKQ